MTTKVSILVFILLLATGVSWGDQTKTDVVDRLNSSTEALHKILAAPDKGIPEEVLEGAKCVAVVPGLIKGGFIVAGKHGRGVATCKLPRGRWSAPALFTISGGSWGAQIGVESVDLVMLIMNDDGMRHLLQDKFQIGGEAAAAAGPVGRHAAAGTDWKLESQMLTYSRSKGLFAGIDLGGSWVERDKDSTLALYGKDLTSTQVLTGKVAAPVDARVFVPEVRRA